MPAQGGFVSSTTRHRPDLVVIGAGIAGLAVAQRAAARGLAPLVLDRGKPGGATTHVAAGMLAPVSEAAFGERALTALSLAAAERWPAWAAEVAAASGLDPGLRESGTLLVARDRDQAEALERELAFRHECGLPAERLLPSAARALEPALAPTVRLALDVPGDHAADPRLLTAALAAAIERTGGTIRSHTEVAEILVTEQAASGEDTPARTALDEVVAGEAIAGGPILDEVVAGEASLDKAVSRAAVPDRTTLDAAVSGRAASDEAGWGEAVGGRVQGVRLSNGETIETGAVVIATGPWAGAVPGLPAHARVPVRPVKGQTLRLRDPSGPGLTNRVVRSAEMYLVPRGDGRYVLGATVEERGFDTSVTAGAVHDLLREAAEVVPGVLELEVEQALAGLRPGTPDNAPILGPGAIPGLHWAAGHYRHGILLAPLTGDAVVAGILGEPGPAAAEPFTAARFARERVPA
jgi:glycine oxidase